MKSGAPFYRIDIISMIYLDETHFSVVNLNIYYEKLAIKTALTTMRHCFAKKLHFGPFNIIWNSIVLKYQCLKHTSKFFIHVFCISNNVVTRNKFTSFRPWKLETLTFLTFKENLYMNLLQTIIYSLYSLVNKNCYYKGTLFLRYVFSLPVRVLYSLATCYVEVFLDSKLERIYSKKKNSRRFLKAYCVWTNVA